jgi:hypothetical protein
MVRSVLNGSYYDSVISVRFGSRLCSNRNRWSRSYWSHEADDEEEKKLVGGKNNGSSAGSAERLTSHTREVGLGLTVIKRPGFCALVGVYINLNMIVIVCV